MKLKTGVHCSHPIHRKKPPKRVSITMKSWYHRFWFRWHSFWMSAYVLHDIQRGDVSGPKSAFKKRYLKAIWHFERI